MQLTCLDLMQPWYFGDAHKSYTSKTDIIHREKSAHTYTIQLKKL